jgi:hypothetical protein
MTAFGTAEHWRERADKVREYLRITTDPLMRRQIEEIIEIYEDLARRAEGASGSQPS